MLEDLALFTDISAAGIFDFIKDKPPHLRTKKVVTARSLRECLAETDLRESGSVERSGVEKTRAGVPDCVNRCKRFLFGNVPIHVAKRCSAKPQRTRQ